MLFEMPICDPRHGCVNGDTRMADSDWVTIKLPRPLAERIDQVINETYAYPTRAELVREAVKSYLTRIGA